MYQQRPVSLDSNFRDSQQLVTSRDIWNYQNLMRHNRRADSFLIDGCDSAAERDLNHRK